MGGQGKGAQVRDRAGRGKEVERKQARGQVRGTGGETGKMTPGRNRDGVRGALRRDKGSGQMRKDQRKGGSTDEIKEVSERPPAELQLERVGVGASN